MSDLSLVAVGRVPEPQDPAVAALRESVKEARPSLEPAVASRWRDYLARIGAPARTRANLEALASGAACVVTGQQAGLLTGPGLTLVKAAACVGLARRLSAASGREVVPVFWVAADDHDLGEINHTFLVNQAGQVQRLRLQLSGRAAAATVTVPDHATDLLPLLLGESGQDPGALKGCAPAPGDTLTTWFSRCLLDLLGEDGLVPLEPEVFGPAAAPLFERALREAEACSESLARGAARLRARSKEALLEADGDPPVFLIRADERRRVRRDGEGFRVGDQPVDLEDLLALARDGVPRLSANVALRPVLQAALLPAVAYVAGPAEEVYLGQLAELHELLGVTPTPLVPRPRATVLGRRAVRAARKLGLAPGQVLAALEDGPAVSEPEQELLRRGAELRSQLESYVEELLECRPSVEAAASRRARQVLQGFEGLLERAGAALSKDEQVAAGRRDLLAHLLRPRGRPQERVLNLLPLVAEHGRGLLSTLQGLWGGRHWLLTPDGEDHG